MTKHYSDLLRKHPENHHTLIWFDPQVVDRYREQKGPWTLSLDRLGSTDSVDFWIWVNEEPVLLVPVTCSMGIGPAKGKRGAYLTDLLLCQNLSKSTGTATSGLEKRGESREETSFWRYLQLRRKLGYQGF